MRGERRAEERETRGERNTGRSAVRALGWKAPARNLDDRAALAVAARLQAAVARRPLAPQLHRRVAPAGRHRLQPADLEQYIPGESDPR